jgi:4-diphosphocytidyl-2-C-methyl-D-erythritol kinase
MVSATTNIESAVATTHAPAKLNLFLELLARREDGFHEIDTVMVAIDLCDELTLRRSETPAITIDARWLPSFEVTARRLGIRNDVALRQSVLNIPEDESNLVHRALERFRQRFDTSGGFQCSLRKRIPAGAGLGGASSDAAAALLCASRLCDHPIRSRQLHQIASEIGSDVAFFLGECAEDREPRRLNAARARGRGERIAPIRIAADLHFVVVFPPVSLSTGAVYARSRVPSEPRDGDDLAAALQSGDRQRITANLGNRLSRPAQKIAPRIDEILDSMWRSGLEACQLTGSGSACFALARSAGDARRSEMRLRSVLEPGALISVARCTTVPAIVSIR